jgi:uncharacterized membrane protein HdeD (DUF308 family)
MTQLDMAAARVMAQGWWTYVVRGVIAVAFGVLAFLSPLWGLTLLVALFGIWALTEGVTSFMAGMRARATERRWWVEILEAIVSIAAGILALVFPALAAEILIYLIAAWAIVIGVFQVYLAVRIRDQIKGEFWLALAGAAAIIFGIATFLFPAASALSITWLIGSFAIAFGLLLVILGWRLRRIAELVRRDEATEYPAAG